MEEGVCFSSKEGERVSLISTEEKLLPLLFFYSSSLPFSLQTKVVSRVLYFRKMEEEKERRRWERMGKFKISFCQMCPKSFVVVAAL